MREVVLSPPLPFWQIDTDELQRFVADSLRERFGPDFEFRIKAKRFPGEHFIYVHVPELTPEVEEFCWKLEGWLIDSGVSASVKAVEGTP